EPTANGAFRYLLPSLFANENIGIDETISITPNPISLGYKSFLKRGKKPLEIVYTPFRQKSY
ncbi:MAG: hypothetical protein ACJAX3_000928, partial [Patiriisocius sp.]